MNTLAPVVIFAYRRPEHLRNTLASLMRCEGFAQSPIIVYCDGPRDDTEVESVAATRMLAKSLLGEQAEYHFSEENLGLSRSVIAGVSETVDRFGRVIVVEDDLELHPDFLTFMNQGLQHYGMNEYVYQVSGYMFNVPELKTRQSALFLPFPVSWGWATWKRAWDKFDPQASDWETLFTDKNLRHQFNLDGAYDYATMLVKQMSGRGDSWAVRWYWTVFNAKGLVLFPSTSLVSNTGFDGSGTHGRGWLRRFTGDTQATKVTSFALPEIAHVDQVNYASVKRALLKQNGGWLGRAINHFRWLQASS